MIGDWLGGGPIAGARACRAVGLAEAGSRKISTFSQRDSFSPATDLLGPTRAEPWSSAGPRLGAFLNLIYHASWYLPVRLVQTCGLSGASPHHRRRQPTNHY